MHQFVEPRQPDRNDMHAAMRGLGMHGMSIRQLAALRDRHRDIPLFTSRTIALAAQAVIDSRQYR